ncbi:MAG: efflux RND transporter permease subunit [Tidjanibacter sp.]|nr:efflux RND transporter permease subunit [Tidjanibacter sp.]
MNIKTFIDRPIFAGVISVIIVLLGLICLVGLPVEQFPEIAPPTVSVSANYSGANAETVQKSVVIPLEEAINGVENMMYMTSSATNNGSANVQIYFRQGTNADMAMVNVQNRIASAQGLLPAEVTRSGVSVRKRQTSRIKTLAIFSPDDSFDERFLSNYLKINIEPRLSRIAGVGEVDVRGADYSLRIWLDPAKMSKYSLMPSDISAVLAEQNLEAPTGTLGADSENTFRYTLKYRGRYDREEDYADMVIRAESDGTVLRLKDVARIELGSISYDYIGKVNGHPGTTLMISQTSGSNANEIIEAIDKEVEEIRKSLPKGIEIVDLMSTKDFLDASIASVVETLVLAIILVVLVVYLFLQSLRSTLIPSIAIIVSLVGTFAFLMVAGFSLNMITLFALVLVIGTVVDNAIVVVEAVQAKFDAGYTSPYKATVDAMQGISKALIATTFVFMAVFIPVCFMGGTTGTFYTQFGLTMAVAVGISLLNSITLSPALCALLMKPHLPDANGKLRFSARFHVAFDAGFRGIVRHYKKGVKFMLKQRWLTAILVVVALGGLFYMLENTKTGLVPKEDMGSINIDVQTPPGTNLGETVEVMEKIASRLNEIPQIQTYSYTTGYGMMSGAGSSCGMFTVKLRDWDERKGEGDDIDSVMEDIYDLTSDITSAKILVFTRGMIPGYGASGGFEIYIQDQKGGTIENLKQVADDVIEGLNERPEIARASTSFDTKYPQYLLEVDAAKCKRNGVSPSNVLSVIAGYVGGNYASNMNRFSKLYRVMIQANPESRLDTESLANMFVRNSNGEMSPIAQYVTLTRVYGPQSISRFNLFSAISVNGQPANGYSSGEAIEAVREVAAERLPAGYGFEFGGMSREEAATGSSTAMIFVICVVFIYLILCALYESLCIPIVIILSVPFGLAGSFLFANMFGLENNIYLQIGLLMLIGLLAKTAILLTEYASERRKAGASIVSAALSAAKARLRAILMTSLTMVFGMLPMMFATGVGANGNISIGVGTVGGMLVGTIALLFVVPALFVVFQYIEEKVSPNKGKRTELEEIK